jgi:ribosomal protein L14
MRATKNPRDNTYSGPHKEATLMRETRARLVDHCGGYLSQDRPRQRVAPGQIITMVIIRQRATCRESGVELTAAVEAAPI